MSKFVKGIWLFVGLLFFAAIAFSVVSYWIEQPHRREIQNGILSNSFARVQPRKGKVLFVPSQRGRSIQMVNPTVSSFEKPVLLSTGSQFRIGDEHFLLEYTVSRIEADGVTIDYKTDGGEPSAIRRSHGSLKLGWK